MKERFEIVVFAVSVNPLKTGTFVMRSRAKCDSGSRRSYRMPSDLVGRTAVAAIALLSKLVFPVFTSRAGALRADRIH